MMLSNLYRKAYFYIRISYLFLIGRKVKAEEYASEYDIVSKTYDANWTKNMGRHTEELIDRIVFPKGYSLLDIACGTGFIIEEALKKKSPSSVLGIDNSKNMIGIAIKKIGSKKARFICNDAIAEIKKLPDESFDVVTCSWAFAYMDKNVLLREIHRVLKPKGIVAIIVNRKGTIESINESYLKLMKRYPERIQSINDISLKLPKDSRHLRKMIEKNSLHWVEGWDKEQSFEFKKGKDAVDWVRRCGAIAGTFNLMDIEDLSKQLSAIIEKDYRRNGKIKVVHRFTAAIGQKL